MPCKIALIGAGSVVFAKTLICDLLQFPEFKHDVIISLMDIDSHRLAVAQKMVDRVIAKLGSKARVEATMDRREAIRGAKYVLCTIQVGGYHPSTVRDFEIPKKYGLQQTIGDTLGVGGIFRGLRTIPVMLDIAREIESVAHPDCLFINYTNPMAMLCMAVDRAVGIPQVGLCHSVFGTARLLAAHAGLPFEDISYVVAGVNHMAFFLRFRYRGQDAYPLLYKVMDDPNREFEKVRYEMMRRTGYFVTESSEHQAEYTPYFIHHGQDCIERFDIPIDEYLRRCEIINASWEDSEKALLGEEGDIEVPGQSHEYGSYIIHSIETNVARTVYGNVPNRSRIENLPDSCVVEIPCLVDGCGLQPVQVGALPPQLSALCMTQVNVQELTVQAAVTGKREHIYHAAMLDPHTAATLRLDQIWALCDELIAAHQQDGFLGTFDDVVKTGRTFAGLGDRVIARLRCDGVFSPKAGERHRLLAITENPTDTKQEIALSILPEDKMVFVSGSEERRTVVPARGMAEVAFEIENGATITTPSRIQLRSSSMSVFCQDLLLKPQKRLTPAADGIVRFGLTLSGFPAGEVSVVIHEHEIEIGTRINDSNVQVHEHQPWKKSSVELMFAPDAQSAPRLFYVVPSRTGNPKVKAKNTSDVPGITVEQTLSESFYDLRVVVPVEKAGLSSGAKKFMFNFGANISALGEAHSGGRTALCPETSIEKADVTAMALLDYTQRQTALHQVRGCQ